jgi:hypothetical protein
MTGRPRLPRTARAALLLALLPLAAGCSGRVPNFRALGRSVTAQPAPGARRSLPRAVSGEFDPLGPILERRAELALTAEQAETVRSRRREFRAAGRGAVAALDSLDWALEGKLRPWLSTSWGGRGSPFGNAFAPKLTAEQYALFERHVGQLRDLAREARRAVDGVLSPEQAASLQKLEQREARAAKESQNRAPSWPPG